MKRAQLISTALGSLLGACAGAGEPSSEEPQDERTASEVAPSDEPEAPTPDPSPTHAAPHVANAAPVANQAPLPFESQWADEVHGVVAKYASWGRLDDEARWAPGLCRMPRAPSAHASESDDPKTHGEKLYSLYAMDPVAYGAQPSAWGPAGVGLPGVEQVIVKESFEPIPIERLEDTKGGVGRGGTRGAHGLRPAMRNGKRFVAGERRGLYLMIKLEEAGQGTDAGWVYATVEPDMMTVSAVGLIDACAGCHREAGEGRLFGLSATGAQPADKPSNRDVAPL